MCLSPYNCLLGSQFLSLLFAKEALALSFSLAVQKSQIPNDRYVFNFNYVQSPLVGQVRVGQLVKESISKIITGKIRLHPRAESLLKFPILWL